MAQTVTDECAPVPAAPNSQPTPSREHQFEALNPMCRKAGNSFPCFIGGVDFGPAVNGCEAALVGDGSYDSPDYGWAFLANSLKGKHVVFRIDTHTASLSSSSATPMPTQARRSLRTDIRSSPDSARTATGSLVQKVVTGLTSVTGKNPGIQVHLRSSGWSKSVLFLETVQGTLSRYRTQPVGG